MAQPTTSSKRPGGGSINLRPTISDVAKEAGVAVSTVSAIMRRKKYCYASEETRNRVMEVAKALGYSQSPFANSPRQGKTHLIALVLPDLAAPHLTMSKFAKIEDLARQVGYRALVGTHQNNHSREAKYIREFLQARAEGFVLYPVGQELEKPTQHNGELVGEMVRQGIPLVAVESPYDFPVPNITVDRELGGYLQVKHLLGDAKCTKLAFLLMASSHCVEGQAKIRGHRRALHEYGCDLDQHISMEVLHPEAGWFETGLAMGEELVKHHRDFDGIVLTSDSMALGVMRALNKAGLRVPDDVAIIGFDDDDYASVLPTSLSTIHQPRDVGEKAFDLLMQQIDGKLKVTDDRVPTVVLKPHLVVRESTVGGDGAGESS